MTSTQTLIELDHVALGWKDKIALRDISGCFTRGSLTAIVGPNGAGKSTLLKGLTGQINPLKGRIAVDSGFLDQLALLPQMGDLDKSFPVTVHDLVAMGAWKRVGAWGGFPKAEHERLGHALEQVGLADFARRSIGTLSGGQLQRALFARMIMQDAQILLLDEPFAAVDRATSDELMNLILDWHKQGRTVMAVLHDLDMVRSCFPQTVLLAGQVVGWGQTEAVLTPENLHLARHLCAGDYL
ncbi:MULTISPECIES: metal ABC transporter ATP-binding protein [Alcaligenes]|jgi:zinc/manganese transport system ATP-binding protein|uniref:Metal ABC transporter ATP-binding protein n=2 Tax=Alcaligenes TaxID=507 RepID=A0A3G2HRJ8_9BURK|nr:MULTISPECIES: metal ABC transporter ATP-binding protein [Alcaligenes]ASR88327.1 ABC transporter [Alcaligenes faecalis]AWG35952.1 ABC transporter [Alcaligenes aquatilis]AYN19388.1 metal ABC transporter ATP-binding protein [Alcaligenes aquatilis]MCC9163494.1 metal ABC transporter ATP-binding protein [Alcaligenes sp. MMA]QXR36328.1 metal ABC transporter ATP-binding protein [Alcaligenes aquatilis]